MHASAALTHYWWLPQLQLVWALPWATWHFRPLKTRWCTSLLITVLARAASSQPVSGEVGKKMDPPAPHVWSSARFQGEPCLGSNVLQGLINNVLISLRSIFSLWLAYTFRWQCQNGIKTYQNRHFLSILIFRQRQFSTGDNFAS